jgi:hypothetical protein
MLRRAACVVHIPTGTTTATKGFNQPSKRVM